MHKVLNGAIVALGIAGAALAIASPAIADDVGVGIHIGGFGVGAGFGNVAYGYRDGYWDRDHHWHHWRNRHEARDYRNMSGNHYADWRHDRDRDQGWHEASLNVGDVAFGYQDGYWDHAHQWHQWRSDDEMRYYRSAPGNQFSDWRHDRDNDQGWREAVGPSSPQAVSVAFNTGDVAFGYQDGYWDHAHQWHQWRNDDEMRYYRSAPGNQYNDWRHDRDSDLGWHQ